LAGRQGSGGRPAFKRKRQAQRRTDVTVILSDGFDNLGEAGFDLILCNPPYQADFAVPRHFIEKGFNRLVIGGRMLMVTKRELWHRKKFTAIFGGVTVHRVEDYVVFEAVRKRDRYANRPASDPGPTGRKRPRSVS
jgi:16S rRNA (guanine1207-N2)-methyltransferase